MCEAFPGVSCSKKVTENTLFGRNVVPANIQPSPFVKSASYLSPLSSSLISLSLCSFLQPPHLLTLFTSLSFATHLPSSSDQSFTDSHISSRFVFLPFYSAVLAVSDCFILCICPLFLFLMFLLLAPITLCLRSLVCCCSLLLLYRSISLCS